MAARPVLAELTRCPAASDAPVGRLFLVTAAPIARILPA